jgi:hypothetical protein
VPFRVLISWVGACALGEALGLTFSGVIAGIVGAVFAPAVGDPSPWMIRGLMILAGFLEGACVGGAQVALLRRRFPELSAWGFTAATGFGMAAGWAIGSVVAGGSEDFVSPNAGTMIVFALASGIGLGAILGTVQALLLRRHTEASRRWIAANVLGWSVAMVVSYLGTNAMPGGAYGAGALGVLLITGGVMGAIVGLATGLLAPRRAGGGTRNAPGGHV